MQIIKKNVKNLTIRITSDCKVKVTAPKFYPNSYIYSFISSKQNWIDKNLAKCKKDNNFLYLGKVYQTKFSDEFYYSEAKVLFNKLIRKYLKHINKRVNIVRIKKMNTRWGSCNYKKGYINLNLHLIKKDIRFIEYVVLHELTHLIHPNHSKEFYKFIENIMPDFKERINGISNNENKNKWKISN